MKKTIYRKCALCGKHLRIYIAEDGTYEGGHYFGDLMWDDLGTAQYWECGACYQ